MGKSTISMVIFAPFHVPHVVFFLKRSVWWRIFRESLAPVIFKILDKESMFIPSDTGRSHLNLAIVRPFGTDWFRILRDRKHISYKLVTYLEVQYLLYIYRYIHTCIYIYYYKILQEVQERLFPWLLPGLPPLSLNFTWCSWQLWNPVKISLVHLLFSCVIVRFGYIPLFGGYFFWHPTFERLSFKVCRKSPFGGFFMMFNHVSSRELCLFFYEYLVKSSHMRPQAGPIFFCAQELREGRFAQQQGNQGHVGRVHALHLVPRSRVYPLTVFLIPSGKLT